jgi:hypothetical protein
MQEPGFKKLFLWCDGFVPEQYFLNETPLRIVGHSWIGDRQEVWKFTLSLPLEASSRENIDWGGLLSTFNTEGWLFVAPAKKELEMKFALAPHR